MEYLNLIRELGIIPVILGIVIWGGNIIYKHNTSRKILMKALKEARQYKTSAKIQINRKYQVLEDLITSMSKQYIATNDGIEFVLENANVSYFLETGVENNYVPVLRVIK